MKSYILLIALLIALFGCKTNQQIRLIQAEAEVVTLDSLIVPNTQIENIIAPYRSTLNKQMDVLIGETETDLLKERPESTLGNFTADAILFSAKKHSAHPVDAAITNYGGLRIQSIEKGGITKGRVYELMPFDNMLVVMEMDSTQIYQWANHFLTLGGWPLSQQWQIKVDTTNMQFDVKLNGEPLENGRNYRICTSDYIANGGDNCEFLKAIKREALGVFFRDGIIEYVEHKTAKNEKINASLQGRIQIVE